MTVTRAFKLLVIPIFAVQLLFFGYIALHRFVDGDEGFYLMAARLVLMHKKPYIDFFYTQTPLLPYIYAFFLRCFGVTWFSAKLSAAMLTALLGTAVFFDVTAHTRRWITGLIAVVLFGASTFVFAWFPLVKTYSLSILFLFAAYLIVSRISAESSHWAIASAGLFLGLTVDTRSYLILVAPLFVWWIWRNRETSPRIISVCWFAAGLAVGLIPSAYLFLLSPSAFFFNNLGYHAIRTDAGLLGLWGEKIVLVIMLFLDRTATNGIQNGILLIVTLGLVSLTPKRGYPPRLAFQVGLVLGLLSLLPTPAYIQYFSICVPFFLVSAVCMVADFVDNLETGRQRTLAVVACSLLVVIYVAASGADFRRYLLTGDGVPGAKWADDRGDWRLPRILEISQAVNQMVPPGAVVASFAPAYVFQTHAVPLPGLESDFALPVSEKLTPEQRARYHILSPDELTAEFAAHEPQIIVLRKQIHSNVSTENWQKFVVLEDSFRHILPPLGYVLVRSIGNTSIYAACPAKGCSQK